MDAITWHAHAYTGKLHAFSAGAGRSLCRYVQFIKCEPEVALWQPGLACPGCRRAVQTFTARTHLEKLMHA